jgi:putative Mn2+ efflux pump MntP
MLKEVEILVAILILFLGVICIFNARWLVKKKLKSNNENRDVNIVKWISYVAIVISLIAIKYIR